MSTVAPSTKTTVAPRKVAPTKETKVASSKAKTTPSKARDPNTPMKILSIDVGEINLALRVESRPDFQVHLFELVDISGTSRYIDHRLKILSDYLRTHEDLFSTLTHLVIEKQMKWATRNTRIMYHIESHFVIFHPQVAKVEVESSLKTQFFDAKIEMTALGMDYKDYEDRKEWAVLKAKAISTKKDDQVSLDVLRQAEELGKADDLADALVQVEAWWLNKQKPRSEKTVKPRSKKATKATVKKE